MTRRLDLKSEDGFTLVELLATMVAGIVVLMALLTIMDVTLQNTTRAFSQADATQRVRPAFTAIENELHSACFADEETPIQTGSGANALIFLTSTGTSATPNEWWHEIDYNPAPQNTLTDTTYATVLTTVNGVPTWTRGTQQSSRTVLTNVGQSQPSAGQPLTPVFQYFAYQTAPGTDAAGNQYEILPDGISPIPGTSTTVFNPLAPSGTLSANQAASAAEVLITLKVGPAGHDHERTNYTDVGANVSDAITFRFTPAANHVGDGATFDPCE
jgi:type II secretory pathway component PulJ